MSGSGAGRLPEHVVVVGGGAVGLCAAEALLSRGCAVTLLERERAGAGASSGNAGWITPSLAIPIPAPGVVRESLRWLFKPSGPLWIRPSLSRAMLDWAARFVACCSRAAHSRGLAALQAAAARAGGSFDALGERGVGVRLHAHGLLYPAFAQGELRLLLDVAAQLREAGCSGEPQRVTPAELCALEPSLSERVIGGVSAASERSVRPEELIAALRAAVLARGADVQEGVVVTALLRDRAAGADGAWVAQTSAGPRRAQAVVLANGVAAADLLSGIRPRLPLLNAKGYSRTYAADPSGPRHSIYLESPRVAISPFAEGARVSGTLELGATDLSLSRRRLAAISSAAAHALPGWRMAAAPSDWAGMRSLTPDGLPVIGAVSDGLYVASGHATLGITLAPLSGELLAELILERRDDPLLTAFAPDRFAAWPGGRGARTPAISPPQRSAVTAGITDTTGGTQ